MRTVGDPTSGASVTAISNFDFAARTFIYTRRNTALTGLSYTHEFSTDLATFTTFEAEESSDGASPVETVTVTIPLDVIEDTDGAWVPTRFESCEIHSPRKKFVIPIPLDESQLVEQSVGYRSS